MPTPERAAAGPPAPQPPDSPVATPPASGRTARVAWVLGMTLGLGLATVAILERPDRATDRALPDGAAAVINGHTIGMEELERAMAAIAADSRNAPETEDRAGVLDRLIDQELLVQRAFELGLDRSDRMVRNTLISAIVQSVLAAAPPPDATEAAVETFYRENSGYFARTGRVRLRSMTIATSGADEAAALERAEAAVARLRTGEAFESVNAELGSPPVAPLPDALLPPTQLVSYLGPTPARAAVSLKTGEVSDPIRAGAGFVILQVLEREPGQVPSLEEVRQEVINEMHRRAGEDALRNYIRSLRESAEIRKAPL